MKRPSILLKVAVVISSLLLGGCFVSYRTGALQWLTRPGAPPANPESGSTAKESASDGAPPPDPTLMGGSKSFTPDRYLSGLTPADTVTPDTAKQPPRDTGKKAPPVATQREPVFMGGSKAAAPPPAETPR